MTRTTKKDFETFKEECKMWVWFFGIKEWDIKYLHEHLDDCTAQCHANLNAQYAELSLNINTSYDEYNVVSSALHEVLELLCSHMQHLMSYSFSNYLADTRRHAFIQTMMNSLLNNKEVYKLIKSLYVRSCKQKKGA